MRSADIAAVCRLAGKAVAAYPLASHAAPVRYVTFELAGAAPLSPRAVTFELSVFIRSDGGNAIGGRKQIYAGCQLMRLLVTACRAFLRPYFGIGSYVETAPELVEGSSDVYRVCIRGSIWKIRNTIEA